MNAKVLGLEGDSPDHFLNPFYFLFMKGPNTLKQLRDALGISYSLKKS